MFASSFNASCELETGIQTNVFSPTDNSYHNKWLWASLINSSYLLNTRKNWVPKIKGDFSGDFYTGSIHNISMETGIEFSREWEKNKAVFDFSGGYFSQPGLVDMDQPLKHMLYSFSAQYSGSYKRTTQLNYSLSVLDELGKSRTDVKNKIKVKIKFKPKPWLMPQAGIGIGNNISDNPAFAYNEFEISSSVITLVNDKNIVMTMISYNPRFYTQGNGSIKKNNLFISPKKRTIPMGILPMSVNNPGAPITAKKRNLENGNSNDISAGSYSNNFYWMFIFIREFSKYIDLQVNYTHFLYNSNFESGAVETQNSGRISVGFTWLLNTL
ncbi:MAG: hypothetical protein ABIA63_14040 [bacterium]